jgi:hypothetical protein
MNQRSLNFRAIRQNFDQRWSNFIMTTIISKIHRFLFRSLIFRSSNLFRQQNHRICFNQMINSQFWTIKNQNLKSFRIHSNAIAIDFENISHRLHFWVLCSIRLSISFSLRSRYSLSLSSLNLIWLYTQFFFNSSHSKKKSTNSSKRMFFNQSIKTTYRQMFAYSVFDS